MTAGLDGGPVRASRGVVLIPDVTLDAVLHKEFDLVILPGGLEGSERLAADERIAELVRKHQSGGKWVGAICAAPMVLAKAGLLEGRKATAYPGVLDQLELKNTELTSADVEVDGRLVTSKGPGTAMDFALTLIELLQGKEGRAAVETPLQRPN